MLERRQPRRRVREGEVNGSRECRGDSYGRTSSPGGSQSGGRPSAPTRGHRSRLRAKLVIAVIGLGIPHRRVNRLPSKMRNDGIFRDEALVVGLVEHNAVRRRRTLAELAP